MIYLNVTRFAAAWRVRTLDSSSRNTISITQCKRFSIVQCMRTALAKSSAGSFLDAMKYLVFSLVLLASSLTECIFAMQARFAQCSSSVSNLVLLITEQTRISILPCPVSIVLLWSTNMGSAPESAASKANYSHQKVFVDSFLQTTDSQLFCMIYSAIFLAAYSIDSHQSFFDDEFLE